MTIKGLTKVDKELTKINKSSDRELKKQVNKQVDKRLTKVDNIIDLLSKGLNQTQISRKLNVSRQGISKHIKRLIEQGKVRETPESNSKHKFYIVNQFSLGMRKNNNYDLHNIEVALPITILGKLPEGNINMGNWKYSKLKFDDFTIKVNYGKQCKLIIYPPKVYGDNIEEVLVRCGNKVTLIVAKIEENFNCRVNLDEMKIKRKPHLHAFNDPIINKFDNEGIQYHGQNIEYNRSGDAHVDILGFEAMNKYDQLLNTVPKLVNELDVIKSTMGGLARSHTQMFNLQALATEAIHKMGIIMENDHKPAQKEEKQEEPNTISDPKMQTKVTNHQKRVCVRFLVPFKDFPFETNEGVKRIDLRIGNKLFVNEHQAYDLIISNRAIHIQEN